MPHKKDLGKQYEAEKAVHGSDRGNQYTTKVARGQNDHLIVQNKTRQKIAKERGASRRTVKKSEKVKALLKVEAQIAKEAEQKVIGAGKQYGKGHPKPESNLTQPNEEKKRAPQTDEIMAKKY